MIKIEKGKQQVLFNYLPGKTFDFGKNSVIAIVNGVRGSTFHELNNTLILKKVAEQAHGWSETLRPGLRNDVLNDLSRFVIVEPKGVSSSMFPLVFWCTNSACKKIIDLTQKNNIPNSKTCPNCKSKTHKLVQLRFVKVHRCGNIEPLVPPPCSNCQSRNIALEDRNSERISNFVWKCLDCKSKQKIFAGRCHKCTWPGNDIQKRNMDIEVFRSNRTHYIHSATLINIPQNDYDVLFRTSGWYFISAAKYLGLSSIGSLKTSDFARNKGNSTNSNSVNSEELIALLDKFKRGKLNQEEYISQTIKLSEKKNTSNTDLRSQVLTESGLSEEYWERAKYSVLETIIPFELGAFKDLESTQNAFSKTQKLGIAKMSLINDFPVILASYGFSRSDYSPNECYLLPFPLDKDYNGKYPIYVDKVSADAIIFNLNPLKVIEWLKVNNFNPQIPNGLTDEISAKAYFIRLFDNINAYEKLFSDTPEARMVMSLLHTFSHIVIKHAALLCGLDKTSISEYIVPKTLSFAIYCNHRFGAMIGALTSLFEQSLNEWLMQIESERKCVYDPVCFESGANCHSCTHLAETSCRFFNLNLSRIYLFGGNDQELGINVKGFFDF